MNKVNGDAAKRATLLSVVGPLTFRVLRSLLTPAKPGDTSYLDIVTKLTEHFSPKPTEIVQRSRFYSHIKKPGETISTFLAELRALAEYCNFGESLEAMIRDRLVCEINDDAIQKRLLAEDDKQSFAKAVLLAQSYETAVRDATVLLPVEQTPVHKVQPVSSHKKPTISSQQTNKPCYRCGKTGVLVGWSQNIVIFARKIGHIKRVCKANPDSGLNLIQTVPQPGQESASRAAPIVVSNGSQVDMEVDTGSAISLVSEETYKKYWPNGQLQKSDVRLKTYSRELLETLGSLDVSVKYGEQESQLLLIVVKGKGPSLFGRDWLKVIKLDWQGIYSLQESPLDTLLSQYQEVFEWVLGT